MTMMHIVLAIMLTVLWVLLTCQCVKYDLRPVVRRYRLNGGAPG